MRAKAYITHYGGNKNHLEGKEHQRVRSARLVAAA